MNYGNVIKALSWAIENRHEIASDAEAAVHLIRRIEKMTVHHRTTADDILQIAEKGLKKFADSTSSSSNPADGIPTAVEIMNSQKGN